MLSFINEHIIDVQEDLLVQTEHLLHGSRRLGKCTHGTDKFLVITMSSYHGLVDMIHAISKFHVFN